MRVLYIKTATWFLAGLLCCAGMIVLLIWWNRPRLHHTETMLHAIESAEIVRAKVDQLSPEEARAYLEKHRLTLGVNLSLVEASEVPRNTRPGIPPRILEMVWNQEHPRAIQGRHGSAMPRRKDMLRQKTPKGLVLYLPVHQRSRFLKTDPFSPPRPPGDKAALLFGGAIVVVLLCSALLVLPLTRRLQSLQGATREVQRGNLKVRIPESGRDLVGDLGRSFNEMTAQIQLSFQEREDLLQAVAHELGHPVSRLRLRLALLDMKGRAADTEPMEEDLNELEDLISELTQFLAAASSPQLSDPWEIAPLLEQLVEALTEETEFPILLLPVDPSWHINADPRQWQRAVENLIRNAVRYAGEYVVVEVSRLDEGFRVEVRDDGPGIPVEERERVLKPFARLDASRDRRLGGVGLGLAIVSRIVQRHGGEFAVLDAPEGGANMRMFWPFKGPSQHSAT